MSNYPHSLVVVCPAAVRDTLLATGQLLGVDGGMSVELSSDGNAPATHYGSHSWAGPAFVAVMTGQALPDPMPDGITDQDVSDLLAAITVSVDPVVDDVPLTKRAHFDHVVSGLGLQRIEATLG